MFKVFLDANVLFSAAYSSLGGSFLVMKLARLGKITCFSSRLAVKEPERNIRGKTNETCLLRFYRLLEETTPVLIDVSRERAKNKYGKLVGEKDAPILSAAIKAKVNFLVTLDRKHFLTPRLQETRLPLKAITPGELIERYL